MKIDDSLKFVGTGINSCVLTSPSFDYNSLGGYTALSNVNSITISNWFYYIDTGMDPVNKWQNAYMLTANLDYLNNMEYLFANNF